MKKILSFVLVLTIIFSSACIFDTDLLTKANAISIDDIPVDWSGWYDGYSEGWIRRGAEIHINSIKPDGSIIK